MDSYQIKRTTSDDPHFNELVKKLDAFLAYIDDDEHVFYAKLNKTDTLKNVVVLYHNDVPVACGALRPFDEKTMEVKRMYTEPDQREKGFAKLVLTELENWARELGYQKCVLETGHRQPEAISLYTKNGYSSIPNYGKYANVVNSVCFEKTL
jgi:GNAT superfamily N-acetyltransferase